MLPTNAKIAALVMVGQKLEEIGFTQEIVPRHYSVKEAVFPFVKFPGVDTLLGPEMKSTGEVMGIDSDFGRAYAKAQIEAGNSLPSSGAVLVSIRGEEHATAVEIAEKSGETFVEDFRIFGDIYKIGIVGIPATERYFDETNAMFDEASRE